jgi:hypothetical protein
LALFARRITASAWIQYPIKATISRVISERPQFEVYTHLSVLYSPSSEICGDDFSPTHSARPGCAACLAERPLCYSFP